ncbi:MAG: isoprenylcysteine carboxylmethyltransferase family protein [Gemmatales bacterium]
MTFLELKVPPPLVALLVGVAMWGLSQLPPQWEVPSIIRYVAFPIPMLMGLAFAVSGFIAFRRARTTIDPLHPGKATSLVDSGIYGFTRNPMYVGLLFVLLGWVIFLDSPWPLIGPLVFIAWINYLQIIPEERILTQLFGEAYRQYQARVRRWL